MAKFTVSIAAGGSKSHNNSYASIDIHEAAAAANIRKAVCVAGGEVLQQALRDHLERTTHDPNAAVRGTLARSITVRALFDGAIVSPSGKHHGAGTGPKTRAAGYHRAKRGQGTSHLRNGMSNATSAMDVGFYLEYGTPRMRGEHWMELTVEQNEAAVQDAMEREWNKYVDSLEVNP